MPNDPTSRQSQTTERPANDEMVEGYRDGFDPSIVRVLWAAMCSMTQDVHCAQDNLSEDEWRLADRLFARLDAMVNAL